MNWGWIDIFGIEKRRKEKEAKLLAEAQERKRKYRERKDLIEQYLEKYRRQLSRESIEGYEQNKKYAEKHNNTCPKCNSTNIINSIKRTKGEIHGKGSTYSTSSHSTFLFGSYSSHETSGHSKIDGELDTLPVNKCKDCGHEWKIEEAKWPTTCNIFSVYDSNGPGYLFRRIKEYFELEYDPYDEKEEVNSLEEKQENFCKTTSESWTLQKYKKVPRFMLDYLIYKALDERSYIRRNNSVMFGLNENDDEYSYQMPDEIWEVVKKILKWTGEE